MRIQIETTESTSLPLLAGIPDWRLARMEGYNGIGKSLTVRLLQLCTGVQPYRGSRAWRGVREGLGKCQVRIDALTEGQSVLWKLDSRRWPDEPLPLDDGWDGFTIEIDGGTATLSQVVELLSVHRLAGDVGLAETLGDQVEADRVAFDAWATPLTTEEGSPLRAVEDRFAAALDLIARVDLEATMLARNARVEANRALEVARDQLAEQTQRQTALANALQTREELKEAQGAGQAASQRISSIDAELEEFAAERDQLASEITRLEREAARSEEATRSLVNAQRRHAGHQRRLEEHLRELAALADITGLDHQAIAAEEALPGLEDDIDAALREARQELEALVERRAAIDVAPLMSSLLTDLATRLQKAEGDGLGHQALFEPGGGISITVSEVRRGLQAHVGALATSEQSSQGAALAEQIERTVERVRSFEALPALRAEILRRRRLAGEADRTIRDLVAETDTTAAARLEELVRLRTDLDARMHALAYERTALHKRRPVDADVLAERLAASVAETRSSVDTLADDLQAQVAVARDAQVAFREAEKAAHEADRTAADHQNVLQRVVRAVSDDAELAWLRRAQPTLVPRPGDDPAAQAEALRKLAVAVSRANERAGRARTQARGVAGALQRLHERLSGRAESAGDAYSHEVTAGYGREFARWFDEPYVRSELFQGAVRVREVDLRRDRLEVIWEMLDGGERSRPLEAFSRGEQAFAYTRARLASLDNVRPRARNRLVVLDEFGAFIAHDRLARLIAMLAERRDANPEDQHLLILPVSADYERAALRAPVGQRDALNDKAQGLRDRGFILEEL